MRKINTKAFTPLQIEIDGTVYTLKKITNRVATRSMEVNDEIQKEGIGIQEAAKLVGEFLMLYLPVDQDWILDNLDMADCRNIMGGINEEVTKAMGETTLPLASCPDGDNSPK